MSLCEFLVYILAQFAGALAGAYALMSIIGLDKGLGANGLYNGDITASLIIEGILSFVFVLAVLGATSKKEYAALAGLVIGASLTLVHLMGIHFTGTSVNPARSFGPALLLGGESLKNLWVFIVAPLAGGALAALVWAVLNCCKNCCKKSD